MHPTNNTAIGIMYIETANALINFCEQNELFAEILYKTRRTFADCMEVVAKNHGKGISDIDAYRRAVQFYFPNAQIEFLMNITINGDAPDEKYISKESKKKEKPAKQKTTPKKEKPVTKQEIKKEAAQKKKEPEQQNIQLSLI